MTENVDYFLYDFNGGEIAWIPLPDGRFMVDPMYIIEFLEEKESR